MEEPIENIEEPVDSFQEKGFRETVTLKMIQRLSDADRSLDLIKQSLSEIFRGVQTLTDRKLFSLILSLVESLSQAYFSQWVQTGSISSPSPDEDQEHKEIEKTTKENFLGDFNDILEDNVQITQLTSKDAWCIVQCALVFMRNHDLQKHVSPSPEIIRYLSYICKVFSAESLSLLETNTQIKNNKNDHLKAFSKEGTQVMKQSKDLGAHICKYKSIFGLDSGTEKSRLTKRIMNTLDLKEEGSVLLLISSLIDLNKDVELKEKVVHEFVGTILIDKNISSNYNQIQYYSTLLSSLTQSQLFNQSVLPQIEILMQRDNLILPNIMRIFIHLNQNICDNIPQSFINQTLPSFILSPNHHETFFFQSLNSIFQILFHKITNRAVITSFLTALTLRFKNATFDGVSEQNKFNIVVILTDCIRITRIIHAEELDSCVDYIFQWVSTVKDIQILENLITQILSIFPVNQNKLKPNEVDYFAELFCVVGKSEGWKMLVKTIKELKANKNLSNQIFLFLSSCSLQEKMISLKRRHNTPPESEEENKSEGIMDSSLFKSADFQMQSMKAFLLAQNLNSIANLSQNLSVLGLCFRLLKEKSKSNDFNLSDFQFLYQSPILEFYSTFASPINTINYFKTSSHFLRLLHTEAIGIGLQIIQYDELFNLNHCECILGVMTNALLQNAFHSKSRNSTLQAIHQIFTSTHTTTSSKLNTLSAFSHSLLAYLKFAFKNIDEYSSYNFSNISYPVLHAFKKIIIRCLLCLFDLTKDQRDLQQNIKHHKEADDIFTQFMIAIHHPNFGKLKKSRQFYLSTIKILTKKHDIQNDFDNYMNTCSEALLNFSLSNEGIFSTVKNIFFCDLSLLGC
jgi:hypothetical protein